MISAKEILKSHNKFLIKLGLERIQSILELLNNPQNNYKVIHIAGTNGKGSTSKIINDILIEKGYKTGLFTSPHIFEYEERIKVNNEDISTYVFDKLTNTIDDLAHKNNIELSEFELLCAVAFYYFYAKNVDWVVLETGLGGLYDATNVVNSEYCAITSIDFDHTERLGTKIEDIAIQKAGIIKPNSKVAVNPNNKGYEIIKKASSALLEIPDIEEYKENFNLKGKHQFENLSLALAIANDLKIKPEIIKKAISKVEWKYRLEYDKEKNLLIDCAHNPSGIQTLRNYLDENFKDEKKIFIFGCLKNKDCNEMLSILLKEGDELYFNEFDYPSALKFEDLNKKFNAKKLENFKDILERKELKVVCGSIYMLSTLLR